MTASPFRLTFLLSLCLLVWTAPGQAAPANLLPNPGAEESPDGRPSGFGMYVGAGKMSLTAGSENPHSGKAAARLSLDDWYQTEGKPAQISGALLLGGSNGYQPNGALEAVPQVLGYVYDFWVRGSLASVQVNAWVWDEQGNRTMVAAQPNTLSLTDQWQRVCGRFALPEGTKHFALGIGTSGQQAQGAKLGWLEVDDAALTTITFPGGELRSLWWVLRSPEAEAGLKAIDAELNRIEAMHLNATFLWTTSLHIATALGMEGADDATARWDALGEILKRAHARGLQVHIWYSPWIYKEKDRGIELRQHPEWACVNAQGQACSDGVCLARPEVRAFELELLTKLVERYPDLDGIHIEEPGYPWGDYCFCDYCKKTFQELLGIELKPGQDAATRHNWAAFCSTDFLARLREQLLRRNPALLLSANGSPGRNPDWYLGRDWTTWARRGYLDFYVPQIYTESVDAFRTQLAETQAQVEPWTRVLPGMAVSWSGIHPRHNRPETLQGEMAAAREGHAPGFAIFESGHITAEEVPQIGQGAKR